MELITKRLRQPKLRRTFENWANKRHVDGLSTTLAHRNVYILPSQAGFVYAALLLTLLVGSINYQLNLGYLLTFTLAGVGAMSMHITHNNLRQITLALQAPQPTYAGSAANLQLVLTAAKNHRYGVAIWCAGESIAAQCDVEPGAPCLVNLTYPAPARGLHTVPRITLETRFPLGLWRAWTYWQPSAAHGAQVLVYPQPEFPARPLPTPKPVAAGGDASAHREAVGGEFDGVRAYRTGDALKRLVWKKYAKSDELVARDDMTTVKSMLVLSLKQQGGIDTEAALSRLTTWVQACERQDIPFELELAGSSLPCNHGAAHAQAALRLLALHQ